MSRYNIVSTIFLILIIGSLSFDGVYDVPTLWYVLLCVIYVVVTTLGSIILATQYFVYVKYKSPNKQAIAITFDDGPIENKTNKILDILKLHDVPAAFFCIGHRVEKNAELLMRINAEGHLIGNHSFYHGTTFDLQSSSMITKELADTDSIIMKAIQKKPKLFRPPYGVTNPMVAKAVRRRNYTVVGWSIRSFDTVIKDRNKLFTKVTKSIRAGDIVLFHDHSDSMIAMLPDFIKHVKKLGLKVVRVDELLNEKAYG